jgi:hypothetical protein
VNLATPNAYFQRALAKNPRQRPHHVSWVDRDGTARVPSFSVDDRKVGRLARKLVVSRQSQLRRAEELPLLGKAVKPSA